MGCVEKKAGATGGSHRPFERGEGYYRATSLNRPLSDEQKGMRWRGYRNPAAAFTYQDAATWPGVSKTL